MGIRLGTALAKFNVFKFEIMIKVVSLIFSIFIGLTLFAQPEKSEVQWKDGKKYYIHTVQSGQTLYALTKMYGVTADDIKNANTAETGTLKVGQKVWIPVIAAETNPEQVKSNNPILQESEMILHTVVKSETLYGISRKYNVSMEELVKYNPGTENGITLGQILKIPARASTDKQATTKPVDEIKDSIVLHTVLDHETMYSISKRFMVPVEKIQKENKLTSSNIKPGDVLRIPLTKSQLAQVDVRKIENQHEQKIDDELIFKKKDTYSIVLLLPFNLDKPKDALTSISTEFLMGAQLALDSLERLGLRATVNVVDAPTDTIAFKTIFSKKEFKQVDLIIGPIMGANLDITARWCKANKVLMVNPVLAQTTVLKNNPYAYNAVSSDVTLMHGLAKHVIQNHSTDYLVLVKTGTKDDDLYQAFRQKFNALNTSKVKLVEINSEDVAVHIKKGGKTVFIVPSRDKGFTIKFMNSIHSNNSKSGSGTITVFGTKEWVNYDDLKGYYKNKYNFHYASSNDFNYSYDATKNLLRKYRIKYNSDLSKYGTQGFDVSLFFIKTLLMSGDVEEGVMNKIQLGGTGAGNGKENKTCIIIKQQDYEYVKVAEYND